MTFETRVKEVNGFYAVETGKVDEIIGLYMPYSTLNELFMFKEEAEYEASMISSMLDVEIHNRMTMQESLIDEMSEADYYETLGINCDETLYSEFGCLV